jgi:hypothetical protein
MRLFPENNRGCFLQRTTISYVVAQENNNHHETQTGLSATAQGHGLTDPGDPKFGYVQIRRGKNKDARRAVSLTPRIVAMLSQRKADAVNDGCSLESH